jgi:hypothetical protein
VGGGGENGNASCGFWEWLCVRVEGRQSGAEVGASGGGGRQAALHSSATMLTPPFQACRGPEGQAAPTRASAEGMPAPFMKPTISWILCTARKRYKAVQAASRRAGERGVGSEGQRRAEGGLQAARAPTQQATRAAGSVAGVAAAQRAPRHCMCPLESGQRRLGGRAPRRGACLWLGSCPGPN